MRKTEPHIANRVLAFLLTLCMLLQVCPPVTLQASAASGGIITGTADEPEIIGGVGDLSPEEQEQALNDDTDFYGADTFAAFDEADTAADTVYYVSFEDYVGGQFTSKVVKLENPDSVRVVDLIGAAVGGWDGHTTTELLDPAGQSIMWGPYPDVVTNISVAPEELQPDGYLAGLKIDGKEIKNAGANQWFVTVNGNYGAVDYTKYSKADNQYNTLASGDVIRVMYAPENGYTLGIFDWVNGDQIAPDKDDLVVVMGDNVGHPNYKEAEAVLVNADALRSQVDEAKKLFTSLEELAAPVIALIADLPEADAVQEGDRDAVKNARTAYNKLSKEAQAKVTNYQKLLDVEAALDNLLPKMSYYVSLEDHTGTFTSKVMKVEATSKNPTDVIAAAVGGSDNVEIWQGDMKSYPVALTIDGQKVANTNGASQEGNYWIVSVEGLNKYDEGVKKSCFMPWFYDKVVKGTSDEHLADEAVIRLIYTANADNAVTDITNMFSTTMGRKVLSPDKTQLVKDLADKPEDPAHEKAMGVLLNPKATADEVANAFAGGSEPDPDQEKADAVIAQIAALAPVSLEKKEAVAAARVAFDALTAGQQALVTNRGDLEAAEAEIRRLEKEVADNEAAMTVSGMISALPVVSELTREDASDVQAARKAYDALTEEQQKLVKNLNVLQAAEAKIEELNKPVEPAGPTYYVSFEDYTGGAFDSKIVAVQSESKRTVDIIGAALGNADGTTNWDGNMWNGPTLDNIPNNVEIYQPGYTPWDQTSAEYTYYVNGLKVGAGNTWVKNDGSKLWVIAVDNDYSSYSFEKHQGAEKSVIRCLYTADSGRDVGATDIHNSKTVNLPANKDVIVTTLAENPQHEMADQAWGVLLNGKAGQADVENAFQPRDPAADQAAAEKVIDLIKAIPEVITTEDEAPIAAAREAYEQLDAVQKKLVTNYETLQNAEKAYDKAHAQPVIDLIAALPDRIEKSHEEQVKAARRAYDRLDKKYQPAVENYAKLEQAEKDVKQRYADEVIDLIDALPAPEDVTVMNMMQVLDAKDAYDSLKGSHQRLVTNVDKLDRCMAQVNTILAQPVIDMIEKLPTAEEATVEDNGKIVEARNAYNNLSYDQKKKVTNYEKLQAIEAKINPLAAARVLDMIAALPTYGNVVVSQHKEQILATKAAFDALSYDQKQLAGGSSKIDAAMEWLAAAEEDLKTAQPVIDQINALENLTLADEQKVIDARTAYTNLAEKPKKQVDADLVAKLAAAEARIEELKNAGAADQAEADKVIKLIDELGEITLQSEEKVLAAKAALEKLTPAQQALVTNHQKLIDAEAKIKELKQAEADKAEAQPVIEKINGLPEKITLDHKTAVTEAREAYKKLSEGAQKQVPAEVLGKLTAAEKTIADLEKGPDPEKPAGKYTYYVTLEDYTGKAFESRIVTVHSDSRRMNEIIASALGEWTYTASLDPRLNMPVPSNIKNGTDPKGSTATYPIGLQIDGQWVENANGNQQKGNYWIAAYNGQYDANQYFHRSKKGDVKDGSVIRMMYTPDGGFVVGAAGDPYTPQPDNGMGALPVKKEQLILDMATRELTEEDYAKAKAVWLNPKAKQNDVDFVLFTPTYYISLEDYTGGAFDSRLIQISYPSWKMLDVVNAALGAPEGETYYKEWTKWDVGEHHYISGLFLDGKWIENANGSEQKGNFWITSVNSRCNTYYTHTDMTDGAVIRLMYTSDGGKTVGVSDALWQADMKTNKDALIKRLIEEPEHKMAAYVKSVLLNPAADQTTIDAAFDKEATPATGLTLDKTGVQVLKPNESVTVKAVIEPEGVTETLHWTLDCNRKGFTLTDNGDGTATVTARDIPDTFTLTAEISGIEKTVVGCVPTTAYGEAVIQPMEGDVVLGNAVISIEKHSLGGENGYLVRPVALPVIDQRSYTPAMMLQAAFGDYTMLMSRAEAGLQDTTVGALKDPSVTQLTGSMKEYGYLSSGDYGEESQWIMTINNKRVLNPTQLAYARLKDGDVIRFIYTLDGGNDIGLAGNQLSVNKDRLMELVVEAEQDLNGFFQGQPGPQNPRFNAYVTAKDVMESIGSTQAAVNDAAAKMEHYLHNAELKPAESVSLDKTEFTIAKGNTTAIKVEVLPKDTTDSVEWIIEDPSVVNFTDAYPELDKQGTATRTLEALGDGTTTLTVRAGAHEAACRITVELIPATELKITTTDTQLMMKKQLTMQAEFAPSNTTDRLEWSVDHPEIARIDARTGRVTPVSLGKVVITATLGQLTRTHDLEVIPYDGPFVYFEYADGRPNQLVSDDGYITLNPMDAGTFKVGKLEKDHQVDWDCTAEIRDPDDLYSQHYFISAGGEFVPYALGNYSARVTDQTTGKSIQNFTLKIVSSGVTEMKTFINGQEVTTAEAFVGDGSQRYWVEVQGYKDGKWIKLPTQMLAFTGSDDNGHIKHDGSFKINANGTAVFTVVLLEDFDVTASFTATSKNVPVTGFHVNVPRQFVMDSWNGIFSDDYNGLQPYSGYTWSIEPENASNRGLTWESLTPEVAQYVDMHGAGIVPKKAGTAKFRVRPSGNLGLPAQEVEIEMVYKTPLTSVTPKQDVINVKEFTTTGLGFDFQPGNPTEKRMHWTMEPEGIIEIKTQITNDPNDVAIPKMTAFSIIARKTGTVEVTGVPYDQTGGAQPVHFTVNVTKDENMEVIDYLAEAKKAVQNGLIALEKDAQMLEFGSEWTIFSTLRAGGHIDQTILDDYYAAIESKAEVIAKKRPTDVARVILALGAMGKDPTDVGGVNLLERLVNSKHLDTNETSNAYIFTLIAADAVNYRIPETAAWNRDRLIDKILTFEAADGGFGLSDNKGASLDMTGMAMQALAPYCASNEKAKAAFDRASALLTTFLTPNGAFNVEGGENGCSVAQAVTALTAAGIDPTKAEGFTFGAKNMISFLTSLQVEGGGFMIYPDTGENLMGSQQITYGLEAYIRLMEGKNRLYDLTDVLGGGDRPDPEQPDPEADQAAAAPVIEAIEKLPEAAGVTKEDRQAIEAARAAFDGLTASQKKLVTNLSRLEAAEKALADLDKTRAGTVVFAVDRFSIGQGFYLEPMQVPLYEGDTTADIITRVLGDKAVLTFKGNYLSAIHGGDMGPEYVKIPEYITNLSRERGDDPVFDTQQALAYYELAGRDNWGDTMALGELGYSKDSGFNYHINGAAPNVGIGVTHPESGDVIRILYTVWGLGADVSGPNITRMDELMTAMAAVNAEAPAVKLHPDVAQAYARAMDVAADMVHDKADVLAAAKALTEALKQAQVQDPEVLVQNAIGALPGADKITEADRAAVESIRKAYDALTEAQKAKVNIEKLTAAEAALASLAVRDVEQLIDALPEQITEENRAAVEAARKAFDALTAQQQKQVRNADKLAAAEKALENLAVKETEKLIEKLPARITLKDKGDILAARKAYEALTPEQQKLVGNLDKLVAAEKALADLENAPKPVDSITDPASGVTLRADGLTSDLQLIVTPLGKDDADVDAMRKAIPSTEGLIKVYNVRLVRSSGARSLEDVALKGKASLTLPLDRKYDGQTLKVLFTNGGKVTELSGKVRDGSLTLETESLGSFGIVVDVKKPSPEGGGSGGSGSGGSGSGSGGKGPAKTGDQTPVGLLIGTSVVSLAALAVLAFLESRKRKI